ncbi:MAG: hypothetical protein C4330_08865 [Chitinophagaceae bacterium]
MVLRKIFLLLLLFSIGKSLSAQRILTNAANGNLPGLGQGRSGSPTGNDSLKHRTGLEDSITISYRFLDSARRYKIDSSINEYTIRFPIPSKYLYLGNVGTAAKSILFAPSTNVGFDPGFHAFDIYKWRLDRVRFFNTTRPYSELSYTLGSQSQQIIEITHTQNIKPYWNFAFQYRLINAPGFFKNQKTNHNNYLLTSWYESPNKRYNNYFVVLQNKLQASENGGIRTDQDYLNNPIYSDRFGVPTKLGEQSGRSRDFFNTKLDIGNLYREFNMLLRQQYDFGRKDSIVTDSTVIPLFYPRVRFEHTFNYGKYSYEYRDVLADTTGVDTSFYRKTYNFKPNTTQLIFRDEWKEVTNDFSIYQFPDANNLQQFIKLGASLQLLNGTFYRTQGRYKGEISEHNTMGHAEYRNRSKNQKWDILAFGKLYFTGYNAGDYHAYGSLQRLIGSKSGSLKVGFENVNRTPSFIYNTGSAFYLDNPKSFTKENTAHIFAAIANPALRLQLTGDYYLISNYTYINKYFILQQEAALFNVLRVGALKTIRLGKYLNWYAEGYLQQKTGGAQLNIPLLYTRNRIMYEGKLGFKNLNIAFGSEIRYHTPYKPDNYSPVLGQFAYQNDTTIANRSQVDAFINFRIQGFRFFLRAENLNSIDFANGFGFTKNNLAAPDYPYPGMVLRLSIYWSFVN